MEQASACVAARGRERGHRERRRANTHKRKAERAVPHGTRGAAVKAKRYLIPPVQPAH